MDGKNLVHQSIRYQKTATDNAFALYFSLQKSSEELLKHTLEQCTWLPEASKNNLITLAHTHKTSIDQLKVLLDEGFDNVVQTLAPATKTTAQATVKTPAAPKQTAASTPQSAPPKKKTSTVKKTATTKKAATPKASSRKAAAPKPQSATSSPKPAPRTLPAEAETPTAKSPTPPDK